MTQGPRPVYFLKACEQKFQLGSLDQFSLVRAHASEQEVSRSINPGLFCNPSR